MQGGQGDVVQNQHNLSAEQGSELSRAAAGTPISETDALFLVVKRG